MNNYQKAKGFNDEITTNILIHFQSFFIKKVQKKYKTILLYLCNDKIPNLDLNIILKMGPKKKLNLQIDCEEIS